MEIEAERDQLKKENEMLKESLMKIIDTKDYNPQLERMVSYNTQYLRGLARATLKAITEISEE